MADHDLFNHLCSDIKKAYLEFGHSLSWSFLFTPQKTFSCRQKFIFMALNPAGDEPRFEMPSCEDGNDYLCGIWNGVPGKNPLQVQVQELFKKIASHYSNPMDYRHLMNNILSANYVPFRSPRWSKLSKRDKSRNFAFSLWSRVLDYIDPRIIISISKIPYNDLVLILQNKGFKGEEETHPIKWGKVTYTVNRLLRPDKKILLLRLPHLSMYKIFSREECGAELDKVCREIAQAMEENTI